MELSTYFRINARNTGQFERTLIIADAGSLCQLPGRLHRADARREPVARRGGGAGGAGRRARSNTARCRTGIRAMPKAAAASTTSSPSAAPAAARGAKISWTQVETGSAITWKYPSCVLEGDDSVGEFYSVAVTNNRQQADTGTKMIHIGRNTRRTIVSKGISAGRSDNTYRGLVRIVPQRGGRAQPHAMRLAADRRPVRRAYRALYRKPQPDARRWSTRRPPRRSPRTSCSTAASAGCRKKTRWADRQRVLQGSVEGTADGIRRGGAEAAGGQPGRLGGLIAC